MKKQFTLIELLVVIAIIAILAGMLLPALNSARDRARTSSCQNNIKSVNMKMTFYAEDNDDYLSPAYKWAVIWNRRIYTYDTGGELPQTVQKELRCPAVKPLGSGVLSTNYQLNDFLGDTRSSYGGGPFKRVKILRPSSVLTFSDLYQKTHDYYIRVQYSATDTGDGKLLGNLGVHVRHGNRTANAGFVDGHVENISEKRWLHDKNNEDWWMWKWKNNTKPAE